VYTLLMTNDELQAIDKELTKYHVLGFPAIVFLALGGYGMVAEGNAFLALLNDRNVSIGLVILGAIISGWQGIMVFPLLIKKG